MRKTLAALLFAITAAAFAQEPQPEASKPITIALEPLGDTDGGIAARVTFRFANP